MTTVEFWWGWENLIFLVALESTAERCREKHCSINEVELRTYEKVVPF